MCASVRLSRDRPSVASQSTFHSRARRPLKSPRWQARHARSPEGQLLGGTEMCGMRNGRQSRLAIGSSRWKQRTVGFVACSPPLRSRRTWPCLIRFPSPCPPSCLPSAPRWHFHSTASLLPRGPRQPQHPSRCQWQHLRPTPQPTTPSRPSSRQAWRRRQRQPTP